MDEPDRIATAEVTVTEVSCAVELRRVTLQSWDVKKFQSILPSLAIPALLCVAVLAVFAVRSHVLQLMPPSQLTMAAGREGGGYYAIAEQYQLALARDGIELTILDTAGSMDNSRLLASGEADVALLQGGTPITDAVELEALAGVFLEPFLIFYRSAASDAMDVSEWNELRVVAGEPGSGTRVAVNRTISLLDVPLKQNQLIPLSGQEAADALLDGEADVAVFVAPITSPYLQPLFEDETIKIGTLRDSEALARRVDFIRTADIPPAGLDYSQRLPKKTVPLTAMIATLAAQGNLHPALVNRMVRAALEIHSVPSLISSDQLFPTSEGLALPINTQAAKLLENEPNAFEAFLPYWIAAQITRVTLLVVPLLVLLVPLFRFLPGVYSWSMRSRVYRRYKDLVAIDMEAIGDLTDERRAELLATLEQIDAEALAIRVPSKYREHVYTLRLHIGLVKQKLLGQPTEA